MSRVAGIALQCGHRFKSRVQHQVGSRAGQPLCLHCDGDKPRDLPGKPFQSGFDLRLDSGFSVSDSSSLSCQRMICLTMGTSCVFKIAECPAGIHPQYTPLLDPWQEQGGVPAEKKGKGRDLRQQKTCRMRRLQALIRPGYLLLRSHCLLSSHSSFFGRYHPFHGISLLGNGNWGNIASAHDPSGWEQTT